jgi:hypothetical protein
MSVDLFEQLAKQEVPPVPENLSSRVHERLNRALLVLQVTEFLVRVLPYCAFLFARAVVAMITFTASGRYPVERSSRSSDNDRS